MSKASTDQPYGPVLIVTSRSDRAQPGWVVDRLLRTAGVAISMSEIISFPQLPGARGEENCVNTEQ